MGLYRLIYTSARQKVCTDEELQKILDSCKRNNPGNSITGMLLHTDRRFLQVMEGEQEEVEALYAKIKEDNRHGGVNVRHESPVAERIFSEWSMAYKDVSSKDLQYNTSISEEDKQNYQSMLDGDTASYSDRSMHVLKTFLKTA